MTEFAGRAEQLGVFYRLLAEVTRDPGPTPARTLFVRGPRRVGKSRLVEEFLARAVVPHLYFLSPPRPGTSAVRSFAEAAAASTLPGAERFAEAIAADGKPGVGLHADAPPTSWQDAGRLLAEALPTNGPAVVVFDDLPHLTSADPTFGPALQKLFDQELSSRRVLLIGIGSAEPGGGLFQQAGELVVPVLAPSEIAARLQLPPADAFEAFLITGGLPLVLDEWPAGASISEYLVEAVRSSTSALLINAERLLAAEFPAQTQAREVLAAIGSGERGFAGIRRAAGSPPPGSLSRALTTLRGKGLITADLPLSTAASAETRYQVSDPYLRFWLRWLGPYLPEIERGRADLTLNRIRAGWPDWCSRAIQPIIRQTLARLLTAPGQAPTVGAYWTRSNNPEIDVVIAAQAPIAATVVGVGAIKWLAGNPFDDDDYGRLLTHRGLLPGADRTTPVFAVSCAGSSVPGLRIYRPEELLAAW
jgi:hypothetical protein